MIKPHTKKGGISPLVGGGLEGGEGGKAGSMHCLYGWGREEEKA